MYTVVQELYSQNLQARSHACTCSPLHTQTQHSFLMEADAWQGGDKDHSKGK